MGERVVLTTLLPQTIRISIDNQVNITCVYHSLATDMSWTCIVQEHESNSHVQTISGLHGFKLSFENEFYVLGAGEGGIGIYNYLSGTLTTM